MFARFFGIPESAVSEKLKQCFPKSQVSAKQKIQRILVCGKRLPKAYAVYSGLQLLLPKTCIFQVASCLTTVPLRGYLKNLLGLFQVALCFVCNKPNINLLACYPARHRLANGAGKSKYLRRIPRVNPLAAHICHNQQSE
ncbi:hypothetical protein [Eikenella sp. Marseille-P7795]|uniref:hypothetical protein n=1 Tax=Eikenella sp. Marseille-P7795 TaxID=2866577 RepID=UPI001CE401B1|nr:hypothetical protein [Eikenella sp. Marseille-P7795]